MKTRGAHRQYRRRDVELALIIRKLLHEDGFTVAGARKKLRDMGHLGTRVEANARASREIELRTELVAIRTELAALVSSFDSSSEEIRSRISPGSTELELENPVTRPSLSENEH